MSVLAYNIGDTADVVNPITGIAHSYAEYHDWLAWCELKEHKGIWHKDLMLMDKKDAYSHARFVHAWLAAHDAYDVYLRQCMQKYAHARNLAIHLVRHRLPLLSAELTKMTFLWGALRDLEARAICSAYFSATHTEYEGMHWIAPDCMPDPLLVKKVLDGKPLSLASMRSVASSMIACDTPIRVLRLDLTGITKASGHPVSSSSCDLLFCMDIHPDVHKQLDDAGHHLSELTPNFVFLSDLDKLPSEWVDTDSSVFSDAREEAEIAGRVQPGGSFNSVVRASRTTHSATKSALLLRWMERRALLSAQRNMLQKEITQELALLCTLMWDCKFAKMHYEEAAVWSCFFPGKPRGMLRVTRQHMDRLLYANQGACDMYMQHLCHVQRPRIASDYTRRVQEYQQSGVPRMAELRTEFDMDLEHAWDDADATESEQTLAVEHTFREDEILARLERKRARTDVPWALTTPLIPSARDVPLPPSMGGLPHVFTTPAHGGALQIVPERLTLPVVREPASPTPRESEETVFLRRLKALPFECMLRVASWM